MEIKFEQQGLLYVAEFEVASNYSLHIERESRGAFTIAQRGTKQGKYAYITDENYDSRTTIDVDMLGNIYPKYIKITSVSKPTYAEVNFAEQGGGGNSGDGGDGNITFYDVSTIPSTYLESLEPFALLGKYSGTMNGQTLKAIETPKVMSVYAPTLNITNVTCLAIGLNLDMQITNPNTLQIQTTAEVLELAGAGELLSQLTVISKEDFYNIN
jgi:hypothetical protein